MFTFRNIEIKNTMSFKIINNVNSVALEKLHD